MKFQPKDFLVEGLEDIEPSFASFDGQMFAGLLPTTTTIRNDDNDNADDDDDGNYMFWLFQPTKDLDSLTIWFNGGPGCSSFYGALFENSPVTTPHYPAGYPKTSASDPMSSNEWSWTRITNMLYVELPAGTGFSTGGRMPTIEEEIEDSFYNFLHNFYDTFPHLQEKRLFLFGESYAGYYVPSIAHTIHQRNKAIVTQKNKINLHGIGIGNGWMDAKIQGGMVIDYAWWHGLIDSLTRDSLKSVYQDCINGLPVDPPFHEFTVPDECNVMGAILQAAGSNAFPAGSYISPNTYDVTTFDSYPVIFNAKESTISHFFNNPKVKKALHAPANITWFGCIPGAGRRRRRGLEQEEELHEPLSGMALLAHDKPESVVPYVAELLDSSDDRIRVLIYNGDRDMSTCAQGSERLLNEMVWDGSKDWPSADRGLWMVNDQVAGFAKSWKGLDFVVVYNSGHLVPQNVPIPALDLISRLVKDESFIDILLPRFDVNSISGNKPQDQESHKALSHQSTDNDPLIHHVIVLVGVAIVFFCLGCFVARYSTRRRKGYTTINEMEI